MLDYHEKPSDVSRGAAEKVICFPSKVPLTFKDEAQAALYKDPVRTAQ